MDSDKINVILTSTALNYWAERAFVVKNNTLVAPREKKEFKSGFLEWN